jgi:hypothetical protein
MSATPEIAQPTIPEAPQAPVEAPAPSELPSQSPAPVAQTVPADPVAPPQQPDPTPTPAPVSTVPTVTVPTSQAQLTALAQGDPASSVTWLAHFWERVIKKSLKKGWNVVFGGTDPQPASAPVETQTPAPVQAQSIPPQN